MRDAPSNAAGASATGLARAAVSVVDLHKSFGALEVLKGVSLTACEGEVVSILGSSGSGKSTMLRCINLLETPDHGTIRVDQETLSFEKDHKGRAASADRRQVERLRRAAAMVFQSFNLWSHMTVLENVVAAPIHMLKRPRAQCVAEAEALLAKVGIADRRHYYPSSSGRQSLGRWPCSRRFSCSTSRRRPSTPNWPVRSCG